MNLVFFDFDGTLTTRDTLRPFVNYFVKSNKRYQELFLFNLFFIIYKFKIIDNKYFKELFLRLFVKGANVAEVEKIVNSFFEDKLKGLTNMAVFKKLRYHLDLGDMVYIVSANFDFLLKPLIKKWGISGLISTETEKSGNFFTGKVIGDTCKGNNKVKKIEALFGREKLKNAIAYGDSEDVCLLNSVARGINVSAYGLSLFDRFLKRSFDMTVSLIGLMLTGWIILFAYILATIDTQKNGFFNQIRIGQAGKPFNVIKIRTMRGIATVNTNVTTKNDPRITTLGSFLRKTKIDELPQLYNVLLGQMSFVGPRPDVPGFADRLSDDDKIILSIKPGITGPATLKYQYEEELLAKQTDPEKFNYEVVFPDKVKLNLEYIQNYSFCGDIKCILQTIFK